MTDNEIIKALECCEGADTDCWECELFDSCKSTVREIMQDALSLINRQKAEIDSLQTTIDGFTEIGKLYSEIKAEAIKEFAERLKEKASKISIKTSIVYIADTIIQEQETGWYQISIADFDNLVKEMVGDDNG